MSTTAWNLTVHKSAQNELESIPEQTYAQLTTLLSEAAEYKQPSNHEKVKLMRDLGGMFRVRVGDYRALCDLEPPCLRVIMVDSREDIYNRKSEAIDRQAD